MKPLRIRWMLTVCILVFSLVPLAGQSAETAAKPLPAARPSVTVLTAAHVVTMDGQCRIFEPGAVVVKGDTVVEVGPAAEVLPRYPRSRPVRLGERWVLPGLVNAHTHLAMNPMRGMGDDLELMDWLKKYIFPLEAAVVSPEYVYEATLTACAENIRRGVTTVVDMYYFEDDVARAVKEAGLRGWLGETILDFPAPDCKTPEEALAYTERCLVKWKDDPMVKVIPSPHSLYTCSGKYVQAAKALADKYGVPMTLHLSESDGEVKTVKEKYDKSPVKAAEELGILGPTVLAAHCVKLSDKDLDILARTNTAVAHNPDSNLKLASGIARVPAMLEHKIRVSLGTDSSVSNNRQDLFHAMDLAAKMHKTERNDATVLKAFEVVRMATLGGAEAIGAGDRIGSLEAGKQADLIVVDLSRPEYAPVYNVFSHLVYVAHGEAVESVMAGGKWLMRDRRLLTLSEERIRALNEKWRGILTRKLSSR